VYVKRRERIAEVKRCSNDWTASRRCSTRRASARTALDHPRSGELVAISAADRWFTYYYWLDDDRAPDYARTVDIHRKPGYDPVELFMDPAIKFPVLKVGRLLARRKLLGSRALLDVIAARRVAGEGIARPPHRRSYARDRCSSRAIRTSCPKPSVRDRREGAADHASLPLRARERTSSESARAR
jgi:hypothetical protein